MSGSTAAAHPCAVSTPARRRASIASSRPHDVRGRAGSRDGCDRRADRRGRAEPRRRRRCSNTRPRSTALRRRRWPRSKSAPTRCARAFETLPEALRAALQTAAARIRAFHERQTLASWSYRDADGSEFGQRVTPLDRVGVYVPGGQAAYPSSVLMNVIPAHVAGVAEIVMVVPTPGGARNPLVLAAAHLAGVTRAFAIGGAQAIAALAYGTATIPAVDKICGPGNAYVAAAKRRVFGAVGIDMIAGASEVLVIADAQRQPRLGRDGPLRAGRARRARAVDPRHARRRDARRGRGERAATDRGDAAARDHRGVARRAAARSSRCATSTRRARSRTASRRSTWSSRSPIPRACCRRSATRARSSWGTTRRRRSATTARDRITCCRRAAPRGSRRRSASTISRSARACSTSRSRRRARSAPWPPRSRTAKACRRTREARCTASTRPSIDAHVRRLRRCRRAPGDPRALRLCGRAGRRHDQARRNGEFRTGCRRKLRRRSPPPSPRCRSTAIPTAGPRASRRRCARRSASRQSLGLILGNGSDELIQIITIAVARPGATILAPEPSFVMYRMNALYAGVRFVGVPLAADFALDTGAMLDAIERERPALIFLAYPNNPTGNLFDVGRHRGRSCAPRRGSSSSTRRTTPTRMRASCRASPSFRTSSSCGPSRRSGWRGCGWAMPSRRPNGRRN